MKQLKVLFFTEILLSSFLTSFSQVPIIQWQKCFGGSKLDIVSAIEETNDGGFIFAGATYSDDGDVTGQHVGGYGDLWIVKISNSGSMEWQKCFGGNGDEGANSIRQTNDGGYIIGGATLYSYNGDVSGNHGELDGWVVKIDSVGNLEWQKCFGGPSGEFTFDIQQTIDEGYIMLSSTTSFFGAVGGNHSNNTSDVWVVKMNNLGVIEWQKCFGGTDAEQPQALQQTNDGGYIIAGSTASNDGDVSGNHGSLDYWVLKISNNGILEWQKTLGGSNEEIAYTIQQTTDSGYIVGGQSYLSNNGDVSGNHGQSDYWIVKLNITGNIEWQKCLGGSGFEDGAFSVQQTSDNGYIVAGQSGSNDDQVSGNHGGYDYWIVKLNNTGNIQWQKSLGGINSDGPKIIRETIDKGYIIAGSSTSNDGDVTGNHGISDCWIVKLTPDATLPLKLLSFNANFDNNLVSLKWEIANNINTKLFMVERSSDGVKFTKLNKIVTANSNFNIYSLTDVPPLLSTLYYRLYIEYTDGSSAYSNIIPVKTKIKEGLELFPNPANNKVIVQITANKKGSKSILLTDYSAKVLVG